MTPKEQRAKRIDEWLELYGHLWLRLRNGMLECQLCGQKGVQQYKLEACPKQLQTIISY